MLVIMMPNSTVYGYVLSSAVKRVIVINHIQNKSFCLHKICVVYCVYLLCIYKNTLIQYTVGTESIQTPLNVSLFVILQPFAKII